MNYNPEYCKPQRALTSKGLIFKDEKFCKCVCAEDSCCFVSLTYFKCFYPIILAIGRQSGLQFSI